MLTIFKVGDRVTRPVFMDDGTWAREGDKCLSRSPLLHGTVVEVFLEPHYKPHVCVRVRWDETFEELIYFEHGVNKA